MHYAIYVHPVMQLYLYEENGRICDLSFEDLGKGERYLSEPLQKLSESLDAYFDGKLRQFPELPIEVYGTPNERKIYAACAAIPYGTTVSYQELAILAGNKNWARFVGNTMHKNRLPIVIPCHRVLASGGKIGGFGGGLDRRESFSTWKENFPIGNKCEKLKKISAKY